MKKNWQLMMVLAVSAIALVFAFGLKQPLIAQELITVMGSIIALIMFWGMVKTIRSGNFLGGWPVLGCDDRVIDADWWRCA